MSYIPSLEKVQLGLEAAYGDLAAPTIQLVGINSCRITPRVEASPVLDKRGTTMPSYIASINRLWADANISGVVVYDHFNNWLDAMFGIDATNPHAYLAELDPTTQIRSMLLMNGQPDVTYSMGGAIVDRLTIRGSTNGPMTFTAHLLGKGAVVDILETLTDDDVVIAMGHHCEIYIDPISGTLGDTIVNTTAFSFEFDIIVDRKLVWHLGALNPDNFRHGKWGGRCHLSLEMTADMRDIMDEVIGEEIEPHGYMVRVKATDALATSVLTLDMAGDALTAPVMFTDVDGITTLELDLVAKFSDDVTFLSCWGAALTLP